MLSPRSTIRRRFAIPVAGLLLAAVLAVGTLPAAAQSSREKVLREGRGEFEMVLIHGLGANASVWDPVLPFLQNTFHVRTFELSGHGTTQPVANPGIATEVARLEEFLIEEDLPYPTLVGHGLGGLIALQFALDHPADVHRLVLIDSAPRQLASDEAKVQITQALLEDYDRFVASRYLNMSQDEETSHQIVDMALRTDSATFVSLLMSSFDFDVTEQLAGFSVPMLVMGSELMFPVPGQSREMLHQIGFANARSISFKRMGDAGHYVMLENPVLTSSVLLAFGVTADHVFDE